MALPLRTSVRVVFGDGSHTATRNGEPANATIENDGRPAEVAEPEGQCREAVTENRLSEGFVSTARKPTKPKYRLF